MLGYFIELVVLRHGAVLFFVLFLGSFTFGSRGSMKSFGLCLFRKRGFSSCTQQLCFCLELFHACICVSEACCW